MWVVKRTKQLTPPAEWIREGWWEKTQGWMEPEPKGTSSIHPTMFHYTWRPYPSNLLPCESKISNDLLMFPGTSRPPDSSTSLCGSTSIAWHWIFKIPKSFRSSRIPTSSKTKSYLQTQIHHIHQQIVHYWCNHASQFFPPKSGECATVRRSNQPKTPKGSLKLIWASEWRGCQPNRPNPVSNQGLISRPYWGKLMLRVSKVLFHRGVLAGW